jgi:hypothetical protein
MNPNIRIITNNPLVAEKYPGASLLLECGVEGIFIAARDDIHLGATIINHPLSGSIKPNESPYKSLVVSAERGTVDFQSLQLIEGAMEVIRKMPVRKRILPEQVLDDFRVIDLDLLDSAIHALPAQFHL